MFILYAVLGIAKVAATLSLSQSCEHRTVSPLQEEAVELVGRSPKASFDRASDEEETRANSNAEHQESSTRSNNDASTGNRAHSLIPHLSAGSKSIVTKLCLLFAIDSFASGLVTLAWLSFYFITEFNLAEGTLGTLFFITSLVASVSNLFAAPLARRIGLIRTMVFTHLPSAVFLALIGITPNKWVAMIFLILRNCSSSMDQAPRQAFLSNVVSDNERTAVMGIVNVVKTLAQSMGPSITGLLVQHNMFGVALIAAGGLKVAYDLALLRWISYIDYADRR